MYRPDPDPFPTVISDDAGARRWLVSPRGRYVLALTEGRTAAITVDGGTPALLVRPHPDFKWATTPLIDEMAASVTVADPLAAPGAAVGWTWSVPRRVAPALAKPEPLEFIGGGTPLSRAEFLSWEPSESPTPGGRGGFSMLSPDGRFIARWGDEVSFEPAIHIDDRASGKFCVLEAGHYSRCWLVGRPTWSPDANWFLCACYTTKHFDHGWVSAVSSEALTAYFEAEPSGRGIEWDVTGYSNGVPYPSRTEEIGSYEAVLHAAFSSDSSTVYFIDPRSVSGFSFPEFVPLFRTERPELALVNESIDIPTGGTPSIAWTSDDRLAVATPEGRVGSIWVDVGSGWDEERELSSDVASFDAFGAYRVALLVTGEIIKWTDDEEPVCVDVIDSAIARGSTVKLFDPGMIIATPNGLQISTSGDATVHEHPLGRVVDVQVSDQQDVAIVVSDDGKTAVFPLTAEAAKGAYQQAIPTIGERVERLAVNDLGEVMLADASNFLHVRGAKRRVFENGTISTPTASEIIIIDMGDLLSEKRRDDAPLVTALAHHSVGGTVAGLRYGLVMRFKASGDEVVTTSLSRGPAVSLAFHRSGEVIAASTRSAVYLLRPMT